MGQPCDICGDIGFKEDLATCYECKQARAHLYCMRTQCFLPKNWLCESCRTKDVDHLTSMPVSSKFELDERIQSLIPSSLLSRDYLSGPGKGSDQVMKPRVHGRTHEVFKSTNEKMIFTDVKSLKKIGREYPMHGNIGMKPLSGLQKLTHPQNHSTKTIDAGESGIGAVAPKSVAKLISLKGSDSASMNLKEKNLHNNNYSILLSRRKKSMDVRNVSVPTQNLTPPSKLASDPLFRANSIRKGDSSKVKFIPTEEAALLTSGSKASACLSRTGMDFASSPAKKRTFVPHHSGMPASEALKIYLQKGNTNSISRPPECPKSFHASKRTSRTNCSRMPTIEASKVCLRRGDTHSSRPPSGSKPCHTTKRTSTPNCFENATTDASKVCLQELDTKSSSGSPPGFTRAFTDREVRLGLGLQSPSVSKRSRSSFCKPSGSERLVDIDDELFIPRPRALKSQFGSCKVSSQPNGRSATGEACSVKCDGFPEPTCDDNIISNQFSNDKRMLSMKNSSGKEAAFGSIEPSLCKLVKLEDPLAPMPSDIRGHPHKLDLDALWKGSFDLSGADPGFCGEIEAYRPTIVSRKVCEVSKLMPQRLCFKLRSRHEVWPLIFDKERPTANDIALYFLPKELERSKRKYLQFLEFIENNDFAMQTCIGRVELLIFPSKQLSSDSRRLNAEPYMWGVFRHLKNIKPSYLKAVLLSGIPAPDFGNQQEDGGQYQKNVNMGGVGEEVDMEIDMIGGHDVGRVDKPVPRLNSVINWNKSQFPPNMTDYGASSPQHRSSKSFPSPLEHKRVGFFIEKTESLNNQAHNSNPAVLASAYNYIGKDRCTMPIATSTLAVSHCVKVQLDVELSSLGNCFTDTNEYCSSTAINEKRKGEYNSFELLEKSEKDDLQFVESIDAERKGVARNSEVGSCLGASTNIQCPSSQESIKMLGVHALKCTVTGESPRRLSIVHQASKCSCDLSSESVATSTTHFDLHHPIDNASCLQLFPGEIMATGVELEGVRADGKLALGSVWSSMNVCPVKMEESVVLRLSRPQYLKEGDKWIIAPSKERLQEDGCHDELELTL